MKKNIPSPEEFFGVKPGADRTLIRWEKLLEYYYTLEKLSNRIKIVEMGPSSEGNPFIMIYVSEKENLDNLEYYREISLKMSDPRGLSAEQIDELAEKGKAVCMQNYGLHSNEVGGPQMVPLMLYDLITAQDGKLKRILDNVIFIICPCSEPDGEIIFTDWYYKYLGTKHEGLVSPYLRHNWAGHSNNRDSVVECVIESKYLNDFLIRGWKPQAYQDHHHSWPWEERMYLAPKSDPIFEPISPIIQREMGLYGAKMAQDLSLSGRTGITLGHRDFYYAPISAFYNNAQLHNIAGMLTENADVSIATPTYFTLDEIKAVKEPCAICPDPWEGGEWHLSDIVKNMYIASLSLLDELASDPKAVLKRMAHKALKQTERGEKSIKQAYIIPHEQHDKSALKKLLFYLKNQCVEFFAAAEDFCVGDASYKKGTIIVPLAQPNYAAAETYLGMNPYPVCDALINADGSIRVGDSANACISLCMGVEAIAANEKLSVELVPFELAPDDDCFPLSSKENASFLKINRELSNNKKVYRDENGDFIDEFGVNTFELQMLKVGLLKKSATWNEEEGFTRNILKTYEFDYRIVMDKELRDGGKINDLDVLVIPGDDAKSLSDGDVVPDKPVEHHSGLGTVGGEGIKCFVENGGRLIAWEKSCKYVVDLFSLDIEDVSEGRPRTEYLTGGSQLRASIENDAVTVGMPQSFTLTHNDGPVWNIKDGSYDVIASLVGEDNVYVNGLVIGKELFANTPIIIRVKYGKGEIILYTFNPVYRFQQDGTFKLFFNALY